MSKLTSPSESILLWRALLFYVLCISFFTLSSSQTTTPFNWPSSNMSATDDYDDDDSSTSNPFEEKTSLPETAIRNLLNLDIGKYTTQKFHYFNHQNEQLKWKKTTFFEDRCYNDYIRCLVSQTMIFQICAYSRHIGNKQNRAELNSYCDMYMDNCRRKTRFWVGYKRGPCKWKSPTGDMKYIDMYSSGSGGK